MQKSPQILFYIHLVLVENLFIFFKSDGNVYYLLIYLYAFVLFQDKKRDLEKRQKFEELLRMGLIERD